MPDAQRWAVFFGGTFDPPHLGHTAAIGELRRATGLPVIVVPTGAPTYRPSPRASASARAEMVALAVGRLDDPLVTVCRWEVDQPRPTYTVDTVEWLHRKEPHLGLVLALGSDVASCLPDWKSVSRLLGQVRLLVFERSGTAASGDAVLAALRQRGLPLMGAEAIALSTPAIDATGIRERIAAGTSGADMLSPEVADYIGAHHLYREVADPER
ncbi:MAG: nicotinate (nicotinamide) nucleotide adenylyltransferase [Candidatus Dormiibacterota bacterium]